MKIIAGSRSAAAAALAGAVLVAGCGDAGGPAPKPPESANLYVKSFSAPNYTGLYLDEDLQFVFSAPVSEESINPDSIQIRTGPTAGIAPFGQYVRGVFLVDPDTGNRVVIDPDPNRITPNQIDRIEQTGDLSRLEDEVRLDLGYDQPKESTGERRPLFDKSQKHVVTFVPDVPTRASKKVLPSGSTQVTIDDTAFTPGANYVVSVPGQPFTNVLENLDGDPLISVNNRVFTSSFRVVPDTDPTNMFLGSESAGIPRIIHSAPYNGDTAVSVTSTIAIRFSQPLDPRTVLDPDNPQFLVEWVTNAKKSITVPSASVDPGSDTLTSPSHGFVDGDRIQVIATTNTYPGGLPSTFQTAHSVPATAVTPDDPDDLDPNENSIFLLSHGFIGGDVVRFSTTLGSTLPLGVIANTNYYVVGTTQDRFRLSLTKGGLPLAMFTPGVGTHNFTRTTLYDYYVVNASTDEFQLSLTSGGAAIDITSSGIGNHTLQGTKPTRFPIPCTVFLAQQRLGKCEVILTPISPLPSTANPDDPSKSSSSINVTVSALVLDLVGNAMVPSTFSFFTGPSTQPPSGPLYLEFVDPEDIGGSDVPQSFFENEAETTANWNATKPYVGALPGEAVASFAPYAGDASETSTSIGPPSVVHANTVDDDGNFYAQAADGDVTLHTGTTTQRVFNFRTFRIGIGAKVFVTGDHPLVIHCQGAVTIEGELLLDGEAGGTGIAGTQPAGPVTGGAGGAGGPGGYAGGDGAMYTQAGSYTFVSFEGQDGQGPGGGLGGHSGENDGGTTGTFWPRDPVANASLKTVTVAQTAISIAANTITSSNHLLTDGGRIRLTTTGTAPTPLATNTDYYIVTATTNDFQLSATRGGAAIDITAQGTGPHTFTVFSQSPCSLTAPQNFHACRQRECGGGGGYFDVGDNSDNAGNTQIARLGSTFANGGMGGPSWGDEALLTVSSTSASVEVAGGSIVTLSGVPTLVAGAGGSGGGGGGGEDDSQNGVGNWGRADGSDEGGGGGGGGGGAVQIVSYTSIDISGKISAAGGDGGGSNDGGAAGGGGSGGAIWLQCRGNITIQSGAILDVSGGTGAASNADGSTAIILGGDGSPGRIRLEDLNGVVPGKPDDASEVTFDRVIDPEDPADVGFVDLASLAVSDWQNTFIFTPDFSAPTILADTHPTLGTTNRIRVYMQGAPENVTNGFDDPDVVNATLWELVYDSNLSTVVTVPSAAVNAATDTWNAPAHGLANGTAVTLSNVVAANLPGGLDNATVYFVVNATAGTFQLSATSGGTPVDMVDGGSGPHSHAVVTSGLDPAGNWDTLDNNKWWRFRIRYDVDAAHQFTDPLPTVRNALFPIGQ